MFIEAAIAFLIGGATADGITTHMAVEKGAVEVDPIMVAVFGTNKPGLKDILIRGGAFIGVESGVALSIGHFHHTAGLVIGSLLLAQAAVHVWAVFHNLKQN